MREFFLKIFEKLKKFSTFASFLNYDIILYDSQKIDCISNITWKT